MSVMLRLRQYHAVLAGLVLVSYLSGEWGLVHTWLGYAVALVIAVRLIWASAGVRQLGLSRFYPIFAGLRLDTALTHPAISRSLLLGVALTLLGTTGTGLLMDRGRAIGMAEVRMAAPAQANDQRERARRGGRDDNDDGALEDIHEALANLLMLLVALHVTYVLLFKFPLARFMLFIDTPERRDERA